MDITEVRVKLVEDRGERVRAFCSVTLDGDFVIRDLKIIEGGTGLFVAMPSRKLTDHCPSCRYKNHLRARFCNQCGAALNEERGSRDPEGRVKLHADIAHPINADFRSRLQEAAIQAYHEEVRRSGEPDYEPASEESFDEERSDFDNFIADLRGQFGSRPRREPQSAEPRSTASTDLPQPVSPDGGSRPRPRPRQRGPEDADSRRTVARSPGNASADEERPPEKKREFTTPGGGSGGAQPQHRGREVDRPQQPRAEPPQASPNRRSNPPSPMQPVPAHGAEVEPANEADEGFAAGIL